MFIERVQLLEKKRCPTCSSKNVILFGKTGLDKQRFKCKGCGKAYIWKRKYNKIYREKHWFDLWVKEGYSIRQLSNMSGYSEVKLKRIKNFWLEEDPPSLSHDIYQRAKYLLFDGTYFHKNGCLAIIIDHDTRNIFSYTYIDKESYHNVYPILIVKKARIRAKSNYYGRA